LIDRRGAPTVAILPGAAEATVGARDLRGMSTPAALLALAIRPTHRVVVASSTQGVAARLLGARQVTRDRRAA
jgi:hypothetical protein